MALLLLILLCIGWSWFMIDLWWNKRKGRRSAQRWEKLRKRKAALDAVVVPPPADPIAELQEMLESMRYVGRVTYDDGTEMWRMNSAKVRRLERALAAMREHLMREAA